MADVRFAYKPKTITMLLAALFFVLCAGGLFYAGATNDAGLTINGFIKLDQDKATVFYYVLAGLGILMAAGGAFAFLASLSGPRFVVLDDAGVEIPGTLGRKSVRIPYDAITGLQAGGAYKQRWIYVTHKGGKQAIMGSMLANVAQLDEIAELIAARVQEGRRGANT